jgi:transposase-like protein
MLLNNNVGRWFVMESAGYFVTYLHQGYALQQQASAAALCCPVCASKAAVIRTRRSRLTKWFTQKKRYLCRQCKTEFWAD